MRSMATATFATLALLTVTGAAQGAPLGVSEMRTLAQATNLVETVAYRRCWWRQGVRYCRRYRTAYYPPQPYYSSGSIGIIMGIR
jgi:hypothetical protein